jgi:hypothetical protein
MKLRDPLPAILTGSSSNADIYILDDLCFLSIASLSVLLG